MKNDINDSYCIENLCFADVALCLHLPLYYRYKVSDALKNKIKIGQRVVVELKSKLYSGIITSITDEPPKAYNIKYILEIIDEKPILSDHQIEFFKWIADYYIAYIGDVLTMALPSALRLKSETSVMLSPYFDGDLSTLNENEISLVNTVSKKEKLKIEDIKIGQNNKEVLSLINKLMKKDVLITDEEIYNKYSVKKEIYLNLNPKYEDEKELKSLLTTLDSNKKYEKQSLVMLQFIALKHRKGIVKKKDLENVSFSALNALIKKDIITKQDIVSSRLKKREKCLDANDIILNDEQQKAFDAISQNNANKQRSAYKCTLIHGVTGSGKTEVYIKLIDEQVKKGKQVLYLIPEIAITEQLISRLERYFGEKIAVYNSKYSMMERTEIWNNLLNNEGIQIILGSRSSVFLPFSNLGLVIIDEEHDTSYKQTEPVPHYNGRDCALMLAKIFNSPAVLGSATPNIETYYQCMQKKYNLVKIKSQYSPLPLPKIEFVDLKEAKQEKTMRGSFSETMLNEISYALENHHQIIIFLNRRGYAPHIACDVCGYIPQCPNCDVSLVLHKERHSLECHYCGYHIDALSFCPDCHSHSMRIVGIGTEQIEEELQGFFPKAKIRRMDLDSTRAKDGYFNIINDFSLGNIDILCGTQMVTKGLDFANVSLVGVINSDAMLHYPDFRAFERTYQILTQVSGRAGRKDIEGKVIIQTYEKDNIIMHDIETRNYQHLYSNQIIERKMMNFPPFCRMIKIVIQHCNADTVQKKSTEYANKLRELFGGRLFGPQQSIIARIKNMYNMEIYLKCEKELSYSFVKQKIRELNEAFLAKKGNSGLKINIDVDPV